jgi:hypothetical protein
MIEDENTRINYSDIDVEISELCMAINRIAHFQTVESCFGHSAFGDGTKEDIMIWIDVDNIRALNRFLHAFSCTYGKICTHYTADWRLEIYNDKQNSIDDLLHLLLRGKKTVDVLDCKSLAKAINYYADDCLT